MLRLLTDQNFNDRILKGLLRRIPNLDVVRVQEEGLSETKAPPLLEWAAREGRILLTHDIKTIPDYARKRIQEGLPMPGVFVVQQEASIGKVIEDLALLIVCSFADEWKDRIIYVPLHWQ